ncbi:cryptochrome/photolyase family protein [Flavilitoribacter nigricans]|uniref:Deoxyribodipyrimidine photolyase n=1 Tax=Flavilitoribacter nigricans (strain ATCC 23147 / DSM 23189 / NBRC 102662 / NCIMB 1420 / SS-2) TaxID=1122177 RepID=A0A2D0NKZ9_FLAN2|nr:deoxyribodipyrimidine photo-lyase [Flavilitoribacter nigricans]PHN08413.1 deoxyribodipyrimidine photolyase [Flavilitoribacter nigricans DSM 23189 = NBRC 102662]
MEQVTIFWFRRDLRLEDNAGLYRALKTGRPVLPLFIFDTTILDKLPSRADARVEFIHQEIERLHGELEALGSTLLVRHGNPLEVWKELLREWDVQAVYTNHDYEPSAKDRDAAVAELLSENDTEFRTYKDQVIFEKLEVTKADGDPYVVFTPYSRAWKAKLEEKLVEVEEDPDAKNGQSDKLSFYLKPYPNERYFDHFHQTGSTEIPSLADMGFEPAGIPFPDREVSRELIRNYDRTRDYPAIEGTSRLGLHFRFGTISIREKARRAAKLNGTFLNELIWRDFYAMIMDNFPHVVERSFREKYDQIEWRNNEQEFRAWCAGETGYPIVDAGMRELNTTGYMHNRVRMVTASFLTKHLLIDWRWGEAYFAEKLLDYELASNNGGWQWAAGSGTDAAPYFRIFNPESQLKKFDKELRYVKEWVPEYGTKDYPAPIVDHKMARERCLATYKAALDRG